MQDLRDIPLCKMCQWYDGTRAECYDGHIQFRGKKDCDGLVLIGGKGENVKKRVRNFGDGIKNVLSAGESTPK